MFYGNGFPFGKSELVQKWRDETDRHTKLYLREKYKVLKGDLFWMRNKLNVAYVE